MSSRMDEVTLMDNVAIDTIKQLQDELESARNEAAYAGEIGMQLLQTNEELRKQLEEDGESYERKIEDLEQEVHTLSLKLRVNTKTSEAFEEELSLTKRDLESSYAQRMSLLEQNHSAKVNQLSVHIEELQNELSVREDQLERSRSAVIEKDLEIHKLKDMIANQSSHSLLYNETLESQKMMMYQQQCEVLTDDLEKQIIVTQEAKEETEICQSKISQLEQLLKEKERLALEWFNSLKESQEEVTVLRANLETMKVKHLKEDWQAQGNSLFGEVEDRRLQTERDLIKFKVKYESLEKTHRTLNQSYKKLKVDFTALLRRHSSSMADTDHLQRIQRTLDQRNSEYMELTKKFKQLEEQKMSGRVMTSKMDIDFGDKKEYIQYLELEQKNTLEQLSTLKRELQLKSTQLIWECKKLSEAEAKLYRSEKDKARFMNEMCQMKLKLQEALEKKGNDKEYVESMKKEIDLLKQQLQGKIKSGQTFDRKVKAVPETVQDVKEKCDKQVEVVKKTKKPPRMTINLLEELHKANESETEPSSVNETTIPDKNVLAKKISPLKKDDDTTLHPTSTNITITDEKPSVTTKPSPEIQQEDQQPVEVKRQIIHKRIKGSESKAKFDEQFQCNQQ